MTTEGFPETTRPVHATNARWNLGWFARGAQPGPAPQPQTFADLKERWQKELDAKIDPDAVIDILKQLDGGDSASLLDRWSALLPRLSDTTATSTMSDLLSLANEITVQVMPGWGGVAASALSQAVVDIADAITRSDWRPILDESIVRSPQFQHICDEYRNRLPEIRRALQEYEAARGAVLDGVRNGTLTESAVPRYRAASAALSRHVNEAKNLSIARRKAVGKAQLAMTSHMRSTALKIAAPAVAATPAKPLLLLYSPAQVIAHRADRAAAERKTNFLNMRHARLLKEEARDLLPRQLDATALDPGQPLRRLWQGPIEARFEVLRNVLIHERDSGGGNTAALAEQIDQLDYRNPESIQPGSRAAELFADDRKLFEAAVVAAFQGPAVAMKLGKSIFAQTLSSQLQAANDAVMVNFEGMLDQSTLDGIANTTTATEGALISESVDRTARHEEIPPRRAGGFRANLWRLGTDMISGVRGAVSSADESRREATSGMQTRHLRRPVVAAAKQAARTVQAGILEDTATAVLDRSSANRAPGPLTRSEHGLMRVLSQLQRTDNPRMTGPADWMPSQSEYRSNARVVDVKNLQDNCNIMLLKHDDSTPALVFANIRGNDGRLKWHVISETVDDVSAVPAKPADLMQIWKRAEALAIR